jgi:hypothetical protein
MKRSEIAIKEFVNHLCKLWHAKSNKEGVRLQKTQYIQNVDEEIFTITIERGDKLNKEG